MYREEKMEVVKWVGKEVLVMKEYVERVVKMIGNKMLETKLICQYCDHNSNKGFEIGKVVVSNSKQSNNNNNNGNHKLYSYN